MAKLPVRITDRTNQANTSGGVAHRSIAHFDEIAVIGSTVAAANVSGGVVPLGADEYAAMMISAIGQQPAAWFRAGVGQTVTGSGVSTWADQSGNGRDLLQGTDAARPMALRKSGLSTAFASGDTFTRATVATVKDFEGNIRNVLSGEVRFEGQRRVRNLLTYTEDFSNAAWTLINAGTGSAPTKTPNYGAAPDNTITACRLVCERGAGVGWDDYSLLRQIATASVTATKSVFLKSNTGASQSVCISVGGLGSVVTVTSEWQRFSCIDNGSATALFDIGSGVAGYGQASIDILVWHPQLENVTGQSNQNPSEYVSVGAAKLNELVQTEAMDQSPWVINNITRTANATNDPNGNLNADRIVETAAVDVHSVYQDFTKPASPVTYTYSAYLKAGERTWGVLQVDDAIALGFRWWFDLANGVIGSVEVIGTGWTNLGHGMESVGNGWYRCWAKFTTLSITTMRSQIAPSTGDTIIYYAGDITKGIYAWGAQVVQGTTLPTYFPVGNVYPFHGAMVDGVKYFDYENGNTVTDNVVTEARGAAISQTAAGYLAEAASTNLVLQSSNLAAWTDIGTPTISSAAKYVGDIALDLLGDDDAGAAEGKKRSVTFTADANKSFSFVVAQGTSTSSAVRLRDTSAGANRALGVVTWSAGVPTYTATTGTQERAAEALANGGYRIFATADSVVAANTNELELYPATDAALAVGATGTIYIGGVQAENATVASSLMPTTTATVTRNADYAKMASPDVVYVDGIARYMQTAAFTLNQPATRLIAFKSPWWASGKYLADGLTANTGAIIQTGTHPQVSISAGSTVAETTTLALQTLKVLVVQYNGASSLTQVNLGAPVTGNAGAGNMGGITIGADGAGANFGPAFIYEDITFPSALSTSQITRAVVYLAGRHGVSL